MRAAYHLGPGARSESKQIPPSARSPRRPTIIGGPVERSTLKELMLPFGLKSATKLFTALADALEWYIYL